MRRALLVPALLGGILLGSLFQAAVRAPLPELAPAQLIQVHHKHHHHKHPRLPIVRWEGEGIRVDCDRADVFCDDEGA